VGVAGSAQQENAMNLTHAERRDAARFIADVWQHQRRRLRRRPQPHETVIAAYAAGREILDAFVGDKLRFLGAPRDACCALGDFAAATRSRPSALADQAEAALRYLEEAGDATNAKAASIAVDRRIIETMAATYHRDREINDSDVGRMIGLSHTSVRDRRLARAARIMAQLHRDCPDLWSDKSGPVVEQSIVHHMSVPLAA
jgi:hypothetical protein